MSDLEQRLRDAQCGGFMTVDGRHVTDHAADRLRQYREALEKVANARSAMDGGSIAECRRIARTALKETTDVD